MYYNYLFLTQYIEKNCNYLSINCRNTIGISPSALGNTLLNFMYY